MIAVISRENATRASRGEPSRFDAVGNGIYGLVEWRPVGIEGRIQEINQATRTELRKLISAMAPSSFENLIGELLVAIGFDENTVEVTGRSGDGGIDVIGVMDIEGITRIDAAVQVKRVKANIPSEKITALRGSLLPHQRGIFITTSKFTKQATQEATASGKTPISLVDCEQLLDLLFKHSIGVIGQQPVIYEIDESYWPEAPLAVVPVLTSSNDRILKLVPVS